MHSDSVCAARHASNLAAAFSPLQVCESEPSTHSAHPLRALLTAQTSSLTATFPFPSLSKAAHLSRGALPRAMLTPVTSSSTVTVAVPLQSPTQTTGVGVIGGVSVSVGVAVTVGVSVVVGVMVGVVVSVFVGVLLAVAVGMGV